MSVRNDKPLASLSLDLDDKWSYMKTHGNPEWVDFPSYLDVVIPRFLALLAERSFHITVFIVGLMSGRTPEYLGIKVNGRDMKIVLVAFLIHPIVILVPTILAYSSGAVAAIGSGGPYAQAAAQALAEHTDLSANQIAEEAMKIAGKMCIYTNDKVTIEEL